jgi:hypothetical protein
MSVQAPIKDTNINMTLLLVGAAAAVLVIILVVILLGAVFSHH